MAKNLPRVEVEWLDSVVQGGWMTFASYLEQRPVPIKTLGYVAEKTKDYIILLQTMNMKFDSNTDSMTIPRGCVVKITKLQEVQ